MKAEWLLEKNKGEPVCDVKVKFTNPTTIEMLLAPQHTDDEAHNAHAVADFLALHQGIGTNGKCLAMRCTRGPVKGAIGWHFDADKENGENTVQYSLNDDNEYEGGRLCFFTPEKGVEVLSRQAGDVSMHGPCALHGVTRLISGTRYSLFVVDSKNGLGDDCVIEPDVGMMEKVLPWLRRKPYAHFLSSLKQLPSDPPLTENIAIRTFNVYNIAREIGKYI